MDTESFTILLSLSCTTSHPWVSLNASWANQCGAGWNRTKGLTSNTLCPHVSLFSHTHTYQHKHHTHIKFLLVPLFPPPCIYTLKGMESLVVTSYLSLSLDHSHFSCYLSHAPIGPSIHASLEYVIHTYLSKPRQMHKLHIHTCYITYPIDLKSPLFTFISHTTILLNKVWPKKLF